MPAADGESTPAEQPTIFSPVEVGGLTLKNRIFYAPCTRLRAMYPGDLPYDLSPLYYAQRASSGLLIAEATNIVPEAKGYGGAPGIWSNEQVKEWKKVTEAVHKKGGRICLQLWHCGRISHNSLQPDNKAPVSASDVTASVRCNVRDEGRQAIRIACSPCRPMTKEEIKATVKQYGVATRNAKEAEFDYVEIHSAHGYLLDQFLDPRSNTRTDEYGGPIENRARFTLEVVDECVAAWSADRVAIRISPYGNGNAPPVMPYEDADVKYLVKELDARKLAYLHISEADWMGGAPCSEASRKLIRENYHGVIVAAGSYTKEKGNKLIAAGYIDATAFGRPFIANPDLVERLQKDAPLNKPDPGTFYGGHAVGYLDYPRLCELTAEELAALETPAS